MVYETSPLPFEQNYLEPYLDEQTLKIHYEKHHRTYTDKLNEAVKDFPDLQMKAPEELLVNISAVPEKIRPKVINFGGGHVNHSFFWSILKKGEDPQGEILKAINKKWGNFDKFREEFSKQSSVLFGSGWVWLVYGKDGLEIFQTANQNSPLSYEKTPLMAIDLWEHAYYLKYQNRKQEWIDSFFKIINWKKVNEIFLDLTKQQEEK
jgi:Fe-Mn family superoxide dismutase